MTATTDAIEAPSPRRSRPGSPRGVSPVDGRAVAACIDDERGDGGGTRVKDRILSVRDRLGHPSAPTAAAGG